MKQRPKALTLPPCQGLSSCHDPAQPFLHRHRLTRDRGHDLRLVCRPRRARPAQGAGGGLGRCEPGHRARHRDAAPRRCDGRGGGPAARDPGRRLHRARHDAAEHAAPGAHGRWLARRARRRTVAAAGAADAAGAVRPAPDAAGLAATAARRAGAAVAGRTLLPRRLEGLARGQRHDGFADRHRHLGRVRPEPLHAAACGRAHTAPVLRIVGDGDHPGAARQVARSAREAPDHRCDPRAQRLATEHRPPAPRWPRCGRAGGRDPRRRHPGRAPGRAHRGRWRGARRPQPCRRIAAHRREPAGGQGRARPRHRRRRQRRGAAAGAGQRGRRGIDARAHRAAGRIGAGRQGADPAPGRSGQRGLRAGGAGAGPVDRAGLGLPQRRLADRPAQRGGGAW